MASPKEGHELKEGHGASGGLSAQSPIQEQGKDAAPAYPTEEEHDGSLIHWILDLTPEERLRSLENVVNELEILRRGRRR